MPEPPFTLADIDVLLGRSFDASVNVGSREQMSRTAQGLISETITRLAAPATSSIMVDGTVYYMALGLRAGDVVSNIVIAVNSAGVGLTLSKVGLYSKTGTLLAQSAELGTAWQSTGIKVSALTSPYTVLTDDGYYVAIVSKGGTLPTPIRTSTLNTVGNPVGAGIVPYATQTGQVDLPSPGTPTLGTTIAYWCGVS